MVASSALRFCPSFNWVDGVPAVLFVVAESAAQKDDRADAGKRQRIRGPDFTDGERSARLGQSNPPATAAAGPYSDDSTSDGRTRL
jgi:hypothetical protein